ncbi:hypothetical protein PFISCL1PPCAC_21938, partial [Pristionchus fissidentatus]
CVLSLRCITHEANKDIPRGGVNCSLWAKPAGDDVANVTTESKIVPTFSNSTNTVIEKELKGVMARFTGKKSRTSMTLVT